ncbi:hypothetical protein ACFSTC_19795 [Nonomuraea ferruginea]
MTSWLEDQLKDALTADAERIRPETLRPAARALPARRLALAVPLAAALVVVVIGAVAAMVAGTRGAPTAPATHALTGPRFLLMASADGVTVHDARTGKVTSRLGLPPPLREASGSPVDICSRAPATVRPSTSPRASSRARRR